MECAELSQLREQVHQIRREMAERRERARTLAARRPMEGRKDERQDLLSRRLAHAVASIEQHVTQHKCQE